VTGLEPNKEYTFCMVATNEAGAQATPSVTELKFKTEPLPPAIESESYSNRKASEVRLEGTVNPNNQLTECHFQYAENVLSSYTAKELAEKTVPCEPADLPDTFGGQGVGLNVGGLNEKTTYHYRIVAKNGKGEEEQGKEEEFKTAFPPEAPETKPAEEITSTTTTLHGVLNPLVERKSEEPETYEFVYRQSSSECRYALSAEERTTLEAEIEAARTLKEQAKLSEKRVQLRNDEKKEGENIYTPREEPAPGTKGAPVEAKVAGLTHGAAPYTFCLLVHNEAGEEAIGPAETFTTLAVAPEIKSESASVIESAAATLNAEIVPEGAETTYHFQYGTSASYEQETQPAKLNASDDAEHLASVRIPESGKPVLHPSTTYHFRVIAANTVAGKVETVHGADETFTTNPTPGSENSQNCTNEQRRAEQPYGLQLPDCRAYEMVSPLETNGKDATDQQPLLALGLVRASEDVEQEATVEAAEPAITYASRGAFAGAAGSILEDQLLSRRDPAHDRWSTRSITAPQQEASIAGGYGGVFFTPQLSQGLVDTYAPASLSSGAAPPPGYAELDLANFPENPDAPISYQLVSNLPPGEDEYTSAPYQEAEAAVQPEGASSDLSHVAFEAGAGQIFGLPLYESTAGRVFQVGVSNTVGEDWTVNAGYHTGVDAGGELQDVWHAMSADGSRVVFTRIEGAQNQLEEKTAGLYVRVNGEQEQQSPLGSHGECTVATDACTVEIASGAARYWGASANGEKVFYTENGDLYEYALPPGQVTGGRTTALTTGGEVQGVAQISEDGSYVYFVAGEVLENEHREILKNASGVEPSPGTDNLYLSHEGTLAFIATLSEEDRHDWNKGPEQNQAVVSPNGNRLAFTSEASLTGYDNQQAAEKECEGETAIALLVENKKCLEVYLYDAETNTLVCASCNPSGARPVGGAALSQGGQAERSGDYRPRALLEDGALFFDSSDALVPHASDGRENVYEFEDGHVYAISNVAGGQESFFLDASPDGQDVFFGSSDQLLPEDTGDNVVVWDARADGGFPVTVAAPPCTTAEACRTASPPTPGVYGPPPSATFSGPGNVSPPPPAVVKKVTKKTVKCKKGDTKNKKGRCVPKKKKKTKKANKSADTNRRTR
jgi:WD40-like Beta Propeller Repeat